MRKTIVRPFPGQNPVSWSSSGNKTRGNATRHLKSQSPQKRKRSAESAPQEEPSPKPEFKKIKLAGTSKPEHQPLRGAQVPQSSYSKAKHPSALRTNGYETHSKKSSEPISIKDADDSSTAQLRPQDVASPAMAESSSPISLSGAVEGDKATPADATRIAQEWIQFGTLQGVDNPKASIFLRAPSQGLPCHTELIVGHDQLRRITVTGPHVGKHHGKLILEQSKQDELPLRRRVRIERTDVAKPIYHTSLGKGKGCVQVGKSEVLSDGDRVRLGDGPWCKYESPKAQSHLYGDDEANSTVLRVKRRSDNFSFVAKMIDGDHSRIADRELEAFNRLGHHPNITQFVEAFYDEREGIHYIVLEAAQADLLTYVSRMGQHRQRNIIDQAPQIIAQAANAIAHVHFHEMAHHDIKPENLLISITELGHIKLKLCDFGLARSGPQAMSEIKWEAGTLDWMAPASFMMYPYDDRLVDCYGIGRILYFL